MVRPWPDSDDHLEMAVPSPREGGVKEPLRVYA